MALPHNPDSGRSGPAAAQRLNRFARPSFTPPALAERLCCFAKVKARQQTILIQTAARLHRRGQPLTFTDLYAEAAGALALTDVTPDRIGDAANAIRRAAPDLAAALDRLALGTTRGDAA